jgi:hypothetical protein
MAVCQGFITVMKRTWIAMGCVLASLPLAALAQNQEPAPPAFEKSAEGSEKTEEPDLFDADANAPKQVQVQVEFVEMPHEALTKLLFLAKPKSADATDLRKQVQDMVSRNEAKVIETQIVIARSGQKATSESIHEFIYPTEYEPPGFPAHTGSDAENAPKDSPQWSPAPTPTAFETRNLGTTVEIEPTIGEDNRIIDLRFVPELIWHTGNVTWQEGKDKFGNPFTIEMPEIYMLRLNTAFTCISGQYTLVGVVSPKDEKGETDMTRKVMVFVKCYILAVK